MDIIWQYNRPSNPANAAIGPQRYDHHLYYRLVLIILYDSRNLAKVVSFSVTALACVDNILLPLIPI
jgi:hypothetical protein